MACACIGASSLAALGSASATYDELFELVESLLELVESIIVMGLVPVGIFKDSLDFRFNRLRHHGVQTGRGIGHSFV